MSLICKRKSYGMTHVMRNYFTLLEYDRHVFDKTTNNLVSDNDNVDICINRFADTVYDISYQLHGKTFCVGSKSNKSDKCKRS